MAEIAEKLEKLLKEMSEVRNQLTEIKTDINESRNELREFKSEINKKLDDFDSRVLGVEASQDFISKEFESTKQDLTKTITETEKKLKKENSQLNEKVNNLEQQLDYESYKRNEASQYLRSSFMVEFSGLPPNTKGENSKELVCKIAKLAKMENFEEEQIDVAHRLSNSANSPIIVTFQKKHDRQNFYFQKSKLRNLHVKQLTDEEFEQPNPDEIREPNTFVYLNESLTPENRDLLTKTKVRAKQLHYKYPGYTKKGQVKVRKTKTSDEIAIQCYKDIDSIF